MKPKRDYYEVLGLRKEDNPDAATIKKCYRKLAIKLHPDRHVDDSEEDKKKAEEQFKEVAEAYSVLSDPDKKARYDQFGDVDGQSMSGFDPFEMFTHFGGFGGAFDDLRSMFGGGASRGSSRQYVQPGSNVRIRVPVSIEDVYLGVKKKLKYNIDVRCPNCHGTGGQTHQCPHCHGTGVITETQRSGFGIIQQQKPCPYCNATGEIVDKKCPSCNGSGFTQKEKIFEIELPAGIQDGNGVQYRGEGGESKKPGGMNGDLIVIAQWKFDQNQYTVDGLNITERVKVPYYDAILGKKLTVELPDGKEVAINLAPCTPSGKKLALRNRGITGQDQFGRELTGSYIIEIVYDIPSELSEEEKKLLEKIQKLYSGN